MQVTSTTDAAESQRPAGGGTLLTRLNNPLATGLIAFAGWLIFVLARWADWAHRHVTLFIMSGSHTLSHPSQMVPRISHVPSLGYDGQYYYRFARNPFNWHATAYGITVDHNYRYTRIGYSLVAWLFSLGGNARLLPTVLVLVNLVCVGLMGYLGAKLARESGRHALWGLLFVAYFGLVISVGRDTSEPLADACMLGGLLAYRHARYILAALLVSYGVFTNEPILVLPVTLALVRLYQMWRKQAKPGKQDLVWVLPGTVYLALQGISHVMVKGTAGGAADVAANLTLPFKALVPGVYRDIVKSSFSHLGLYNYNLIEFIALAIVVVAGFAVIRSSTAPPHERAIFTGFVLVEMVIASGQFWDSTFGDGRTFIDAFLMAVILLLATPASAPASAAPAASVAERAQAARAAALDRIFATGRVMSDKRLAGVFAFALVVLVLVARRHILFQ